MGCGRLSPIKKNKELINNATGRVKPSIGGRAYLVEALNSYDAAQNGLRNGDVGVGVDVGAVSCEIGGLLDSNGDENFLPSSQTDPQSLAVFDAGGDGNGDASLFDAGTSEISETKLCYSPLMNNSGSHGRLNSC